MPGAGTKRRRLERIVRPHATAKPSVLYRALYRRSPALPTRPQCHETAATPTKGAWRKAEDSLEPHKAGTADRESRERWAGQAAQERTAPNHQRKYDSAIGSGCTLGSSKRRSEPQRLREVQELGAG